MTLVQTKTFIEDLLIIEPKVHFDKRGYFFESFNHKEFNELIGADVKFVQDNQSSSEYGTIRGLHYQYGEFQQAKLVRVLKGRIFDVAVDLRSNSNTFKKWFAIELSAKNFKQLWIPRGFAHGYLCLSDDCEIFYKVDNYYSKFHEKGINFKNKELNIDWPITEALKISEKDSNFDINDRINPLDVIN